ncbi:MAG: putative Ig domain-containing protein [Pirellulales bacterium]
MHELGDATNSFDTQAVPLLVTPATPTLELLNNSAALESHDNTVGNELSFRLSNLSPNSRESGTTTVTIYARKVVSGVPNGDPFVIYEGTVNALSMDVMSDGATQLEQGSGITYEFTAKQSFSGAINFGNREGEAVDLEGELSEAVAAVINTSAPTFTSSPPTFAVLGEDAYTYNVESSVDEVGTVYTLAPSLPGASFNETTGELVWTPTAVGTYPVAISIGTDNVQTFQIVVADRPQLDIADQTRDEAQPLSLDLNSLLTDDDVDDTFTFTIKMDGGSGAVLTAADAPATITEDGMFGWTPGEKHGGNSYTFEIEVTDSFGLSSTESFTVTVNETNQNPDVLDKRPQIAVDSGDLVALPFMANDPDVPEQTLTFSLDKPDGISATIDPATGAFSWQTDSSHSGNSYTFVVTVSDGAGGSDSTEFSLYVDLNVDPFFANIPTQEVDEGETLELNLNGFVNDGNGDTITVTIDGEPITDGPTILSGTNTFSWTPTEAQGEPGGKEYVFTVTASDGNGGSDTTEITVIVNEVNTAPVITPIADFAVDVNDQIAFDVHADDVDLPTQTLTFSLGENAPAGASIDPNTGAFSWQPGAAFDDTANTITVFVTDSEGGISSESFTVYVSRNVAPTFATIPDMETNEHELFELDLSNYLSDLNLGDSHTFSFVNGNLPAGLALDPSTGVISWMPSESQGVAGGSVYPLTVKVDDGSGGTATASFAVTVNEANADPVLEPIDDVAGEVGVEIAFVASATDSDEPANTLVFSLVDGNSTGATINPSTGAFSWTPAAGDDGQAFDFTVNVDDGNGGTDSQDFTVYVGVNAPPEFRGLPALTVDEGTLVTLNLNDYVFDANSGDSHTFTLENTELPDGVTFNGSTGEFSWTPSEAQGATGGQTFVFSVSVSDGEASPVLGEFSIKVDEVNTDPTIEAIADVVVGRDETLSFTVTASDDDLPENTLSYSLSGQPTGMTIDPATGLITWTTATDEAGAEYPIFVNVSDGAGGSASTSFTLRVAVAPVLDVTDATANDGVELTIDLTTFLTDENLPGDSHTYELVGDSHGATLSESGMFAFTPNASQDGLSVAFTVRATDSDGLSVEDSFTILVNVAPESAIPDTFTNVNEALSLDLTTYLSDANLPSDAHTYAFVGENNGATLSDSGMFSFTPGESLGGMNVSFTVLITDQNGLTAEDTFVVAINVAPVLDIADTSTDEAVELTIDLNNSLTDDNLPDDTHTFSFVGDNHGATVTSDGMFAYTPDESLGGTDVEFTVRVVDQGGLISESTFTVTVNEANADPVLQPIDNVAAVVDTEVAFDVDASDSDIPAQTLTYSLNQDAPAGATIDANGHFSWTPGSSDDGQSFDFTVTVNDGNGGTASQDFTVYVGVNAPPEFRNLPDMTVNEGDTISFNLNSYVFDPDSGDTHTFGHTNAISGVVVDPATGAFTWTPSEMQGIPGGRTFVIGVSVSDGTNNVQGEFTVVVNEVNSDPTIEPIEDTYVGRDETFNLDVVAADTDDPAQTLTYSLAEARRRA